MPGRSGIRSTLIPLAESVRGFSPATLPPPGGGGRPPGPGPGILIVIPIIVGIIIAIPPILQAPPATPPEASAPAPTSTPTPVPSPTVSPAGGPTPPPAPAPPVVAQPAPRPTVIVLPAPSAPVVAPGAPGQVQRLPARVLPYTGANLWIPVLAGVGLVGIGWPARRRARRYSRRDLATLCIVAGVVTGFSPGLWIGVTGWRAAQAQAQALSGVAQGPRSMQGAQGGQGPAAVSGASGIVISIPSLDLKRFVPDGATPDVLTRFGIGRIEWTGLPAQDGVVGIAGHRTTYGAPFYRLDLLEEGDLIQLEFQGRRYVYHVTGREVVRPDDVDVLNRAPGRRSIALVTCEPTYSAAYRLVVFGTLTSEAPLVSVR